jgi:hypothetical protein
MVKVKPPGDRCKPAPPAGQLGQVLVVQAPPVRLRTSSATPLIVTVSFFVAPLPRNVHALIAWGAMAGENGHSPVIPSPSREGLGIWGGGGESLPRCFAAAAGSA